MLSSQARRRSRREKQKQLPANRCISEDHADHAHAQPLYHRGRRGRRKRNKQSTCTMVLYIVLVTLGVLVLLCIFLLLVAKASNTGTTMTTTTYKTTSAASNRLRRTATAAATNKRTSAANTSVSVRNSDESILTNNSTTTTTTTTAVTSMDEAWPLIHILNTRFMQEQGHLVTLAKARLHLFETFCLPTIAHQSTQAFLWIIKTDPNLDTDIRNQLVALLQPYPNYYLVASNVNFGIHDEVGSWRDGSEGRHLLYNASTSIYSGHVEWLYQAHELREVRPILETRLDADDGLHNLYMQYIQSTARKRLVLARRSTTATTIAPRQQLQWSYWCSRRHVEWYASSQNPEGLVNPVQHQYMCVTPGITVGYSVGVQQVPQYDHDKLFKTIQATGGCHYQQQHVDATDGADIIKHNDNDSDTSNAVDDNSEKEGSPLSHQHRRNKNKKNNMDCIQLVDDLSFVAVRSRTPTSAGMKDVQLTQDQAFQSASMIWKFLAKVFHVSKSRAKETNAYVQGHLKEIAKENLEGQCTNGHSCKNSSAVLLKRLMEHGDFAQ